MQVNELNYYLDLARNSKNAMEREASWSKITDAIIADACNLAEELTALDEFVDYCADETDDVVACKLVTDVCNKGYYYKLTTETEKDAINKDCIDRVVSGVSLTRELAVIKESLTAVFN